MKIKVAFLVAMILMAPPILSGTDLSEQTLKAWDSYIQVTYSQMLHRLTGTNSFLYLDGEPDLRERVRHGEILAEPAHKYGPVEVPHGLIHHWIGAVFIPNVTINQVFSILDDYNQYNKIYSPAVVSAKSIEDAGKKKSFSLVLLERAHIVTAAIDSDYSSQTIRLDKNRRYNIIYSTRIQQIDAYGRPQQHTLPPDKGTGYIWRLYSIPRFEEKDGGVYVECEIIALSRDVPFEFEWVVKPILQHLPRNVMVAMLQKTREAVCAEAAKSRPAKGNYPLIAGN